MQILFTSYAEKTHFLSMIPLAWAFCAAGHEVRVAGPPELMSTINDAGLTGVPVGRNEVLRAFLARRPHLAANVSQADHQPPFGKVDHPDEEISWDYLLSGADNNVNWIFRIINDPMINDLVAFCRSWHPDLVIWEPSTLAGAIAAKASGAAHARLIFSLDFFGWARDLFVQKKPPSGRDPLAEWLNARAEKFGAEFSEDMATGMVTIDQIPPSLRLRTGLDYMSLRHVPYNGRSVVPRWLWEPPERRRVCLTLGTAPNDPIAPSSFPVKEVLAALADLDVEVVATFDKEQHAELGTLPDNVRAPGFVPLHALLPGCSAVIHHGGTGTLSSALLSGIPQLILPEHFDAPAKARRIAQHGAGIAIPVLSATAENVHAALVNLLDHSNFTEGAANLQAEVLRQPTPSDLVPRLAELAVERAHRPSTTTR